MFQYPSGSYTRILGLFSATRSSWKGFKQGRVGVLGRNMGGGGDDGTAGAHSFKTYTPCFLPRSRLPLGLIQDRSVVLDYSVFLEGRNCWPTPSRPTRPVFFLFLASTALYLYRDPSVILDYAVLEKRSHIRVQGIRLSASTHKQDCAFTRPEPSSYFHTLPPTRLQRFKKLVNRIF